MIIKGIVQFISPAGDWRGRLRVMARMLSSARVSARDEFTGQRLIAVVISPQDRDELVELIRKLAELTEVN